MTEREHWKSKFYNFIILLFFSVSEISSIITFNNNLDYLLKFITVSFNFFLYYLFEVWDVCDGTKQISFYFYNIELILNDIERGLLLFHVRNVINSDNCSMDIPLHIEHVCASCHCYFFSSIVSSIRWNDFSFLYNSARTCNWLYRKPVLN